MSSDVLAAIHDLAAARRQLYRRWLAENTADPLAAVAGAAAREAERAMLDSLWEKRWAERRAMLVGTSPCWEDRLAFFPGSLWAWPLARPTVPPPDPTLPHDDT